MKLFLIDLIKKVLCNFQLQNHTRHKKNQLASASAVGYPNIDQIQSISIAEK